MCFIHHHHWTERYLGKILLECRRGGGGFRADIYYTSVTRQHQSFVHAPKESVKIQTGQRDDESEYDKRFHFSLYATVPSCLLPMFVSLHFPFFLFVISPLSFYGKITPPALEPGTSGC